MVADGPVESAAVVLGVALVVVVAGTVTLTTLGDEPSIDADTDANTTAPPREYRPASVIARTIPSRGSVRVAQSLHASGNGIERKVVLIDESSRVEQEDVRQLVLALVVAGHEVRYADGDFNESLRPADAYVRIDPSQSLDRDEIAAVENFTDTGGRVVLVAEPNRVQVSATLFSTTVTTRRTAMVELAAAYGIVFGNRYLYDTTTNDGNFKNVLARPTNRAAAPDLDRVALSTATRVESRDGTVLLRTPPSTRLSNDGTAGRYPVAVRTGNVLALGDGTFMQEGRHAIADNEVLVGYVAEFLVSGDRVHPPPEEPADPDDSEEEDETEPESDEDDTSTPTPAGTPEGPPPETPDGPSTPTPTPSPADPSDPVAGRTDQAAPE